LSSILTETDIMHHVQRTKAEGEMAGMTTLVSASSPCSHKVVRMKTTHVLTSQHPVRRVHCMMLTVKTPAPINVPSELPWIDPVHTDSWGVLIGMQQWVRVAGVLRAIEDDTLTVQDVATYLHGPLILMATSAKRLFAERQRQEAQWAATSGTSGS